MTDRTKAVIEAAREMNLNQGIDFSKSGTGYPADLVLVDGALLHALYVAVDAYEAAQEAKPSPVDPALPCPFCGATPKITEDDSYGECWVSCVCEHEPRISRPAYKLADAIAAWNKREVQHGK